MRKRNPTLAAILSFVFGPFGFLYIGWRYSVMALVVLLIFVFILTLTNFPVPVWMKYIILAVFAWKGFSIVSVRNALIDAQDEEVPDLNSFSVASMAMTDLLVGIVIFYAGAIGVYAATLLILEGNIFKGILVLLLGTPLLVWVASFVFGFIAMAIDSFIASRKENIFRK